LSLDTVLDAPEMRALRQTIARGERPECAACVCPLWRSPAGIRAGLTPARAVSAA